MLENKENSQIPSVSLPIRKNGEWSKLSTDEIFNNRKVVLFALPGAFTPTCSTNHLPRYDELTPLFKANGIDEVICLSVNDPFVMEAWQKNLNTKNVYLLPDGNGELSKELGMLVEKNDLGFGNRSWRYSMYVDNGVIKKMFIEPDLPGDPFKVSDGDTMLNYLFPEAKLPDEVTIITKPGCSFCKNAKELLQDKGYSYEEISLGDGVSYKSLRNLSGKNTAPQIYINGEAIGGLEQLKSFFDNR